MKKKQLLIISLILAISLLSCRLSQFNPFRRIIEYPQPKLTIDNSYFTDLGCFESVDCLPDSFNTLEYPIQAIYQPSSLLGGLGPKLPLAEASTLSFEYETEIPAVYANRCMAQQYIRYLVVVDDEIRLIDSADGMRELYAPIESEDEALSYAMAVTGLSALYDLDQQPALKLITRPLEESHSTYDGEKFTVHLFNTYLCGCGPHVVSSVDVTVQTDGSFSLSDPIGVFSDPSTNDLCID